MELYGLVKLARYLEPYTNRIVMMCELNITSGGKVINKVIKPMGIKSGDVKDIVGCSPRAAGMLIKSLSEKNIIRRDKDFYMNPRYIRAFDTLAAESTVDLFNADRIEEQMPEEPFDAEEMQE